MRARGRSLDSTGGQVALRKLNERMLSDGEAAAGSGDKRMSAAAAEFLKPADRKRQRRTKGRSEAEAVIRFALQEPPQTFGRQFVSDHERPLRARRGRSRT
jgi:hypothetical protein